jgi:hypothetical protein
MKGSPSSNSSGARDALPTDAAGAGQASSVGKATSSDVDISDHAGISQAAYEALATVTWPVNARRRVPKPPLACPSG